MDFKIPSATSRLRLGCLCAWAGVGAACLWVALALLYASFCALLHHEFSWDYPRYFNMIWNSAHGRWFRFFVDDNYLLTHLSFSLVLLAPILRVWDHPFALYVLQWLMIIGGGCLLAVTGRRHGLSPGLILSLFLFYWGYHFTQTTQLDEFHGVAAYLLLIPWLYYCLCYHKALVWLPLLLILGLREDAAFMVLPLLLYVSARDRWRGGYAYAGVALLYSVLALVTLYCFLMKYDPQAHNLTFVRPPSILESFQGDGLRMRAMALGWVLLPLIPLFARGARPALIIASTAIGFSLCSAQWRQFFLAYHYPAVVMACLGVGLLEAARRQLQSGDRMGRRILAVLPLCLVAATAFSYYWKGHLPGSRIQKHDYFSMDSIGRRALWVARHEIPAEGVLLTTAEWSSLVANRKDLVTPETPGKAPPPVDLVFCGFQEVIDFGYVPLLKSGEFGVRYQDNAMFVLQRGFDTSSNEALVARLEQPTIPLAWTLKHAGETLYVNGQGFVRFWKGRDLPGPGITLAYGTSLKLAPGSYQAVFCFKSEPPAPSITNWGRLCVYPVNQPKALALAAIQPADTLDFREQSVGFTIGEWSEVEPRIDGSGASLWMDQVVFRRQP